MNERAKLAQIIVQAIEEFPKVHKFLTSGDTGCHPQHLVDTIAERILESDKKGKDITSQVTVYDYNDGLVSITKCACGKRFKPWDFVILVDDEPKVCPKCGRKMYSSIQIRVHEVEE